MLHKGLSRDKREHLIREYTLHEKGRKSFLEELKEDKEFKGDYEGIHDLFELAELTGQNVSLLSSDCWKSLVF